MTTINIIGTGNVAWHLAMALQNEDEYAIQAVAGRSPEALSQFTKLATSCVSVDKLQLCDLTIIAVADDAIKKVLKTIPYTEGLFVHTSGSVSMEVLSMYKNHGVLYPLQSFSKGIPLDFTHIPICIEASHKSNIKVLEKVAFALSEKVQEISSPQRKKLHIAAVFVNNFTNHCYTIAQDICTSNELSFDLLRPLLQHTAQKAVQNSPSKMQTGPAKRNDQETIATHLGHLSDRQQQKVYDILSQAITAYYGKKL